MKISLEDDFAIFKILYLKTVRQVCVKIKENRKKIAEKLDMDLVKSDHINHVLISTERLSEKLGSSSRLEVAV